MDLLAISQSDNTIGLNKYPNKLDKLSGSWASKYMSGCEYTKGLVAVHQKINQPIAGVQICKCWDFKSNN